MTQDTACEKCGGTGKLRYGMLGDAMPRAIGDGVTIQYMGGSGTRACECVRDLPAIDGKATWWESETLFNEVVVNYSTLGSDTIEVTTDCEVPRDEQGRRVHRTAENAYYPPMIELALDGGQVTLMVDDARKLIKALQGAVDAADSADALARSTINWNGG